MTMHGYRKNKVKEFETVKEFSRWNYFFDYYLKYVIVLICVGILSVTFIKEIFIDKVNTILYVAILNENKWIETEGLIDQLEDYFQLNTEKEEIIVSVYNLEESADLNKFYTLIANEQIDIVISDDEIAQYFDEYGYLLNLAELELSHIQVSADSLMTNYSDVSYGIDLVNNKKYQQLDGSIEHPVLSVISNSTRRSEVQSFLSYLFN